MVMLSDMSVVQQQLQQLNSLKRCSAFHKLSTSLSLSRSLFMCIHIWSLWCPYFVYEWWFWGGEGAGSLCLVDVAFTLFVGCSVHYLFHKGLSHAKTLKPVSLLPQSW